MKTLNRLLLVVVTFFTLTQTSSAQNESGGIYKTAYDFQQNKLSYALNDKSKDKIKDELFKESKIKVVHDGKTYVLDKNNTYGYKNPAGEVFRFVDNKEYRVLNPGESLILYVYYDIVSSDKGSFFTHSDYYFSPDASSGLQPLTKENLKEAFPNNSKFHDALDVYFKTDKDLVAYDSAHKMFKLNKIYKNAL
jgi:hypothetical protein